VDFLLCDPHTMKPVMAFELDDSSHGRDDRISRDAFVERVFCQAEIKMSTKQELKKSTFQDSKSPSASFPNFLTFAL